MIPERHLRRAACTSLLDSSHSCLEPSLLTSSPINLCRAQDRPLWEDTTMYVGIGLITSWKYLSQQHEYDYHSALLLLLLLLRLL